MAGKMTLTGQLYDSIIGGIGNRDLNILMSGQWFGQAKAERERFGW